MTFWAYMLHCRGGAFYVGQTDDLERRIGDHMSGLIPGFTADHQPVEPVWSQEFVTRDEAKAAEKQIKGWSRAKKLALIRGDWKRISNLAKGKSGPSTGSGKTGFGEGIVLFPQNPAPPPNPDYPELVEELPFSLVPHPDTPCRAVDSITVSALIPGPDRVTLCFQVSGRIDQLRLPAGGVGERKDHLWEHTCFEMFSRNIDCQAYVELNFSPSSDWASYDFDSYRAGMRPTDYVPAPDIVSTHNETELCVTASAALAVQAGPWKIALSAIIEETDGTKSYWALAHPPGKPDFHHPSCFALTLAAPEAP